MRIAGASGIFKSHDFRKGNSEPILFDFRSWTALFLGHGECMPYNNSAMRSIYHIREYNIRRLSLLTSPKIMLSHDWPQAIEHYGNIAGLFKRKPYFRADSQSGQLGSPPLMGLLKTLKPDWWFAAHLHVHFEAIVSHTDVPESYDYKVAKAGNPDEIAIDDEEEVDSNPQLLTSTAQVNRQNEDEIILDDEEEDVAAPPPPPRVTKFVALDKCLPRRRFLEVIGLY